MACMSYFGKYIFFLWYTEIGTLYVCSIIMFKAELF